MPIKLIWIWIWERERERGEGERRQRERQREETERMRRGERREGERETERERGERERERDRERERERENKHCSKTSIFIKQKKWARERDWDRIIGLGQMESIFASFQRYYGRGDQRTDCVFLRRCKTSERTKETLVSILEARTQDAQGACYGDTHWGQRPSGSPRPRRADVHRLMLFQLSAQKEGHLMHRGT